MADIDKIVKSANNFYNSKVTTEGRGRFPGQTKYDAAVGGYDSDSLLIAGVANFTSYDDQEGSNGLLYLVQLQMVLLLQVVITSLLQKMMTKMVHLIFQLVLKNS